MIVLVLILLVVLPCAAADPGERLRDEVSSATDGALQLSFEQKGRYESRTHNFNGAPDVETGLVRTRVGLSWLPAEWFRISGTMQDARAPWYGPNAPGNARDPHDLLAAWFELFPARKTGFGMAAGRAQLNYGDGRLIGTPEWGNTSRTYDHARLWYATSLARFEFLVVSPWKVRTEEFNRPVLGDRALGIYTTFRQADVYWLHHYQNRPGGFTGGSRAAGTDRLSTHTFGARLHRTLAPNLNFVLEGALQGGSIGPARQRAGALAATLTRRWKPGGKPFDLQGEYKFASGTKDPSDPARSTTFDQIFPANHDKFGHEDLLGWRNIHHARGLANYAWTSRLSIHLMYSEFWLASARDALYDLNGRVIARSPTGAAGNHVGREADLFVTWRYGSYTLGAGYGRFFAGEFLRTVSPGARPTYLYVFHQFSF